MYTIRPSISDDVSSIDHFSLSDAIVGPKFSICFSVFELLERGLCCFSILEKGAVIGFAAFDDDVADMDYEHELDSINVSMRSSLLSVGAAINTSQLE